MLDRANSLHEELNKQYFFILIKSLGHNIKLLYKSNRLLRNIIRPKHKEPLKKRDRNVTLFEDNNKKAITGRNLQDDHSSF